MVGSAQDIQMRKLKGTIPELNKLVKALQQTIEAANVREAALCQERDNLREQMDHLTERPFGISSEKGKCDIPGQLNLFNEAGIAEGPVAALSEEVLPSWGELKAKPRKKRAASEERLKGLPVEQVFLDVPEGERICGVCGTLMEIIRTEFVRRELKFISAKVKVIEHYSVNYGCPKCRKEVALPQIKKGKGGRAHRIHGMASVSTVAWIMYQRYFGGMSLHRQERDQKQCDTNISRAAFANRITASAQGFSAPMYVCFRKKLPARSPAMADETPVQVLHKPGRRAQTQFYMWLSRSGEDEGPPITPYKYAPMRVGDDVAEFLEGHSGYLMCDGYSGYNKVSDARRTACWAHTRRYPIDAIPKGKQLDYIQPSVQGIMYVNRLFETEDRIRKKHVGDYKAIQRTRPGEKKPAIDGFSLWLEQQKPTRGSRLDKMITYIRNREPYLSRYPEDGRYDFSNNPSENATRPSVVGRRGWLFSDTSVGAETSAATYTMVENAKANGVNVYQYLKLLLEKQPNDRMSGEELERFAPWNPGVKVLLDSRVTDEPENG